MLTRRRFTASLAGASLTSLEALHAALPQREEFVIRNAYLLTMDAAGDVPRGDIHVRNGEIVAVGRVPANSAKVIDGAGSIVLPGLMDTHWHAWNTLLRSMAGDKTETGYFALSPGIGKVYLPDDMYQGARLSCAEAIQSGITFINDWCHNVRSPQHAEADLRALAESGIRARFSYGTSQGQPATQTADLEDIQRLHGNWGKYSNGGLIHLGLAWRGMAGDAPVYQKEFDLARKLGIPISAHVSQRRGSEGTIAKMGAAGLLGKDVTIIHAIWVTPEDIRALASAGSAVSLSPFTEMRTGYGLPKTGEFLAGGVRVTLSVDTTALSGNADMFGIMKLIQNVENARSESEFKLPPRKVLELATIEAARAMGVDDKVGSLRPGKRADLIMVSTQDVNLAVFSDPAHLLVEAAQPANVDTVVVDGRILKRAGKLTAVNPRQISAEANAAFAAARKRANWP
jgi:cytosine/adenosine deaminase-related metal-dependent hydrolase